MNYSVKRSTVATVVGLSTLMLLSACSSDQRYKRQVSGDESYLEASQLNELKAPAGMILPVQRGDFDVPRTTSQAPTGKQLDIRPPAQPLALMNGTRAQFSNNTGALMIDNSRGSVWSQVVNVVQSYKFPIASRNDAGQQLTTDW
ncbi:outer membrane protein assembly factor BamC, partial [Pantoea agglomerans]|nr:outer membrane protein assembly factor BamC [Pantoea agglomerans]